MKNNYPKDVNDFPDNKIIVLGISPGFAGSMELSKSVRRVKSWFEACGISEDHYDWRNCVDLPGSVPKIKDIKLNRYEIANYSKVVCLGNIPEKWCKDLGITHLKVPHPSGINRIWNDPNSEQRVIKELLDYIKL